MAFVISCIVRYYCDFSRTDAGQPFLSVIKVFILMYLLRYILCISLRRMKYDEVVVLTRERERSCVYRVLLGDAWGKESIWKN